MSLIDHYVDAFLALKQAEDAERNAKRRMQELECNIAGTQRAGVYPTSDVTHAVVVTPERTIMVLPIKEVDR